MDATGEQLGLKKTFEKACVKSHQISNKDPMLDKRSKKCFIV